VPRALQTAHDLLGEAGVGKQADQCLLFALAEQAGQAIFMHTGLASGGKDGGREGKGHRSADELEHVENAAGQAPPSGAKCGHPGSGGGRHE
jgi:hypothetical protein